MPLTIQPGANRADDRASTSTPEFASCSVQVDERPEIGARVYCHGRSQADCRMAVIVRSPWLVSWRACRWVIRLENLVGLDAIAAHRAVRVRIFRYVCWHSGRRWCVRRRFFRQDLIRHVRSDFNRTSGRLCGVRHVWIRESMAYAYVPTRRPANLIMANRSTCC